MTSTEFNRALFAIYLCLKTLQGGGEYVKLLPLVKFIEQNSDLQRPKTIAYLQDLYSQSARGLTPYMVSLEVDATPQGQAAYNRVKGPIVIDGAARWIISMKSR